MKKIQIKHIILIIINSRQANKIKVQKTMINKNHNHKKNKIKRIIKKRLNNRITVAKHTNRTRKIMTT